MPRPSIRRVLLLGAFLLGPPAWAARRAEVAVVGVHVEGQSDQEATTTADALTSALERTGNIDAVEPGLVRARLAGREELVVDGTFLGPGRKLLDEGRVLYERAEFESAIPVLEEAVSALEDGLPGTRDSKPYIDALLLMGLAQASVGEVVAAQTAYQRVLVLDPTRRLDPVNYPPKFVSMFDEVRAALLAHEQGQLTIASAAGHDQVYVDGRVAGETPVTVRGLPPGQHHVLVVGPEGQREFTRVELAAGEKKTLNTTLTERSLGEAGGTEAERAQETRRLYFSLGTYIDTQLVLLGGELATGKVGLQLYEPRTGNFSKVVEADAGSDPGGALVDLVPVLANYLTDDGALRPDRVGSQAASLSLDSNPLLASILLDPEPIVGERVVTRGAPWYLWAGVATVAAGGAAVAIVVATRPDEPVTETGDEGVIVVGPFP